MRLIVAFGAVVVLCLIFCSQLKSSEAATLPPDVSCVPGSFKCSDGRRCVPKEFVCDGVFDCGDGGDEGGCPAVPPRAAPPRSDVLKDDVVPTFPLEVGSARPLSSG